MTIKEKLTGNYGNETVVDCTNIYSYALRGDDGVVEVLRKAEQIGFSVISIGYYFLVLKGEEGNRRTGKNLKNF